MGSPIAPILYLDNRAHRCPGLTKLNNLQSLHGNLLIAKEREAELHAPPKYSSDEESDRQEEERCEEDVILEPEQEKPAYSKPEEEPKAHAPFRRPNVNIPRKPDTSPQQNDQKRHGDSIADDDMIFSSQRHLKRAKGYGSSNSRKATQNIHDAPRKSSQPDKSSVRSRAGRAGSNVSDVPQETVLSRLGTSPSGI